MKINLKENLKFIITNKHKMKLDITKEELETITSALMWYVRDGQDWGDKAHNLYKLLGKQT